MLVDQQDYVFLGTIDDVVTRFPWRFKVDATYLNYMLISHLLTGRRVLLNDGYLINHPVARAALQDPKHLLRLLIDQGAVSVMARGYRFRGTDQAAERSFGLHEMPERMAKIATFDDLINGRVEGVPDWPAFRAILEAADTAIADRGAYLSWSPYDTGSGYAAFVDTLIRKRSTASSVGLGRLLSTAQFQQFLRLYQDALLAQPSRGPRDLWEHLARSFAEDPDVTNRPQEVLNGLMRLANEIYHYNFATGISAAYRHPIRVETQPSAAFDDLLLRPELVVDRITDLPAPPIPRAIVTVPPDRLIGALLNDSALAEARVRYIAAQTAISGQGQTQTRDAIAQLKEASMAYGRAIERAYATDMSYGRAEALFQFLYSEGNSETKSYVRSAVEKAVTAFPAISTGVITQDPLVTSVVSGANWAIAYLTYLAGERLKPIATGMFRITAAHALTMTNELRQNSTQAIRAIKQQRTPISLQLDSEALAPIVAQMRLFGT